MPGPNHVQQGEQDSSPDAKELMQGDCDPWAAGLGARWGGGE